MSAERGAENLLVTATDAWAVGDEERATRLTERAVTRPFDRQEQVWPGPHAAHMLLFEMLTHTAETSEPRDWFAAIEATFSAVDESGRAWFAGALVPVLQDWDIDRAIDRQIRNLIGTRTLAEDPWFDPTLDLSARREIVEGLLDVIINLAAALADRGLCSHVRPDYW